MMQSIYYWRDVYGDQSLFAPYQAWIARLLSGERSGLHFEKLRVSGGWPIYSIRVNESDRLLFTTYRGSLCLLDVVLNHDYAKSRFFRNPERISSFIGQMTGSRFDIGNTVDWDLAEEVELAVVEEVPSYQALDYYQKTFIALSSAQEALMHYSLPLIVSGPAGSGKTCTAISVLSQYILDKPEALVLYVSRSRALVERMKQLWLESNPGCEGVEFKTYAELYAGVDDAAIFNVWYARMTGVSAGAGSSFPISLAAEEMWQEFRIRSGFDDDAGYLSLGRRQSSLDASHRKFICQHYEHFMAYLSGQLALNLKFFNEDLAYNMVVVDEAQDFSFAQLRSLYRGSAGQVMYLLGSHQILFDSISRVDYLKKLLHDAGMSSAVLVLPVSYRSGERLVEVANGLIRLKALVTGGVSDKYEPGRMEAGSELLGKGQFECWSTRDVRIGDLRSQGAHLAVITLDAYKDDARRVFDTPLVFTVEEVKGLEFHTVVLWRLLEDSEAREVSKRLDGKEDAVVSVHRAKAGQGDAAYISVCDAWITAVTRAQQRVIWVDDGRHDIRHIYHRLHALETHGMVDVSPVVEVDWKDEFERLMMHGLYEQAEKVFCGPMGRTLEEFMCLREPVSAEPVDSSAVVVPAPVVEVFFNYDEAGLALEAYLESISKKKRVSFPNELQVLLEDEGLDGVQKTWLYALVKREGGVEQLQKLLQRQKDLLTRIPRGVWVKPLDASGRTLLYLLGKQGETGYGLMLNLLTGFKPSEKKDWLLPALDISNKHALVYLLNKTEEGQQYLLGLYRIHPNSLDLFEKVNDMSLSMLSIFRLVVKHAALNSAGGLAKKLKGLTLSFDPEAAQHFKDLALHALEKNDECMLKLIAQWNMAHYTIYDEMNFNSLLHLAVIKNKLSALKILLRPEHVNCVKEHGKYSLLCLAAQCGHLALVQYLCGVGADKDIPRKDGMTPLCIASQAGYLPLVQYLCEVGADKDKPRKDGMTPLCIAVQVGHLPLVQYLCEVGADKEKSTNEGESPLFIAVQKGYLPIVEYLCRAGADIDTTMNDGATPLFIAAEFGKLSVVQYLCKVGANKDKEMNDGATPLIIAIQFGHLEVVDYLCRVGADIDKPRNDGMTPLYFAVREGYLEVVQHLCDLGADINKTTKNGLTVFDIARDAGHKDILTYLIKFQDQKLGVAVSTLSLFTADLRERSDETLSLAQRPG